MMIIESLKSLSQIVLCESYFLEKADCLNDFIVLKGSDEDLLLRPIVTVDDYEFLIPIIVSDKRLQELFRICHYSTKNLVNRLLDLLVNEQFDFENNFIIIYPSNIIKILNILPLIGMDLEVQIWSILNAIIKKHIRNLQACTDVHLLQYVLVKLKKARGVLADFLIEIIGSLISYSVTVKEFKLFYSYFQLRQNSKWDRHATGLIDILRVSPQRSSPGSFFTFSGKEKSMISLPPFAKWPSQNGFTFNTWIQMDINKSHVDKDKPYLFNFVSHDGAHSSSVYFIGKCMVIDVTGTKGKDFVYCVPYELAAKTWYMVTVVYLRNRWSKSEIHCYVNGELISRLETNWVVAVNEPFDNCSIGSSVQGIQEHAFSGQIGSIYLFQDALTTQQITPIFKLGPSYGGQFKYENEAENVHLNEANKKILYDGKLNSGIVFLYNPLACDGQLCLESSPQNNTSYFVYTPHALMVGDVRAINTNPIVDTMNSLGGIQVLYPLFEQVDHYHQTDDPGDDVYDYSLCSKVVSLIGQLVVESQEILHQLVQTKGIVLFALIMQNNSRRHLNEEVVDRLINLIKNCSYASMGKTLLKHIMDFIFFNPYLWILADPKVQARLYTYLATDFIRETPIYKLIDRPLTVLETLNMIKYYYWVVNSSDRNAAITDTDKGKRPDQMEIVNLRAYIMLFLQQIILKDGGIREEEMNYFINYLATVNEYENIQDIIQVMISLVSEHPSSFIPAFDKRQGVRIIFKLLAFEEEIIQAEALKLLGYFLTHSVQKRKQDVMVPYNLFTLIRDRLLMRNVPSYSMTLHNILMEILLEKMSAQIVEAHQPLCQPNDTVADLTIENSSILVVIATLLNKLSSSSPDPAGSDGNGRYTLNDVKYYFLNDLTQLCINSMDNRRRILQMSVWQSWLFDLAIVRPKTSRELEITNLVLDLLCILIHHAIKYEFGGWRVWIDTMAIIHSTVSKEKYKMEYNYSSQEINRNNKGIPNGDPDHQTPGPIINKKVSSDPQIPTPTSGGSEPYPKSSPPNGNSSPSVTTTPSECRPKCTSPKPPFKIPDFRWSDIHQRLLSNVLACIEKDVDAWKNDQSHNLIDLVNMNEHQVFIQNVVHFISQMVDNLIISAGGLLPLLAYTTTSHPDVGVVQSQSDMPLRKIMSFLVRFINLVDVFVFASSISFHEMENEKNIPQGGILRQCLRLGCFCTVRNCLENQYRSSVYNDTGVPYHLRDYDANILNIIIGGNLEKNTTGYSNILSNIQDPDVLLQNIDITRLKAIIYRDIEETKQSQFLALCAVYFVSVLTVSKYRDLLEPSGYKNNTSQPAPNIFQQNRDAQNNVGNEISSRSNGSTGSANSIANNIRQMYPISYPGLDDNHSTGNGEDDPENAYCQDDDDDDVSIKEGQTIEMRLEPILDRTTAGAAASVRNASTSSLSSLSPSTTANLETGSGDGGAPESHVAEDLGGSDDGNYTPTGDMEARSELTATTVTQDRGFEYSEGVTKDTANEVTIENEVRPNTEAIAEPPNFKFSEGARKNLGSAVAIDGGAGSVPNEEVTKSADQDGDVVTTEGAILEGGVGSVLNGDEICDNGSSEVKDDGDAESELKIHGVVDPGTEYPVVEVSAVAIATISLVRPIGIHPASRSAEGVEIPISLVDRCEEAPEERRYFSPARDDLSRSSLGTINQTTTSPSGTGGPEEREVDLGVSTTLKYPSSNHHNPDNFGNNNVAGNDLDTTHLTRSLYARETLLTKRIEKVLGTSIAFLRELINDFIPFMTKSFLGSHGQELLRDHNSLNTIKESSTIEFVMMLCSQEWQNSLQKHAGLAFIELINEGRILSHAMKDHLVRVGNEADFILNRLRAEDMRTHAEFEALCAQTQLDCHEAEKFDRKMMASIKAREFAVARKTLDKVNTVLGEEKNGAWKTDSENYWRLDFWEDDLRRRKKLVTNPFGSSHPDASDQSFAPVSDLESSASKSEMDQILKSAGLLKQRRDLFHYQRRDSVEENELNLLEEKEFEIINSANVSFSTDCQMVALGIVIHGSLVISKNFVIFDADEENVQNKKIDPEILKYIDTGCAKWGFSEITAIFSRRYLLQNTSLEIFLSSRTSVMFAFKDRNVVKKVVGYLPKVGCGPRYGIPKARKSSLMSPKQLLKASNMTDRWIHRDISNFEYLMFLNTIAGRTYQDLNQYPIFPWILSNYETEKLDLNDPRNYRDLSKPIGAIDPQRRAIFVERYKSWEHEKIPPFHYGTHYSTAAFILNWILRIEPFSTLFINLHGGKFDHPNRIFSSLKVAWSNCQRDTSDVKELIPELFYFPEMLVNINKYGLGVPESCDDTQDVPCQSVNDVELPPWASTPQEFVRLNREALESDIVSCHLHHWIDLIFGYKQRGAAAVEALNVFYYLTYEGSINLGEIVDAPLKEAVENQIRNFGQTPSQLIETPHPPRQSIMHISPRMFTPINDEQCSYLKFPFNASIIHISPNNKPSQLTPYLLAVNSNFNVSLNKWNVNYKTHMFPPSFVEKETSSPSQQLIIMDQSLYSNSSAANQRMQYIQHNIKSNLDPRTKLKWDSLIATDDSRYVVATGFRDKSFRVINTDTGKITQTIFGHHGIVTCIARSESETDFYIATGSKDATIKLWVWNATGNLISGDNFTTPSVNNNQAYNNSIGSAIYKRESPVPKMTLIGHEKPVSSISISTELGTIVSLSQNGFSLVHSMSGELLHSLDNYGIVSSTKTETSLDSPITKSPTMQCFTKEGNILVCYEETFLTLYTLNGTCMTSKEFEPHSMKLIQSSMENFTDEIFITVNHLNVVDVWRTYDFTHLYSYPPLQNDVKCLEISKNQKYILAGLSNGSICSLIIDITKWKNSKFGNLE